MKWCNVGEMTLEMKFIYWVEWLNSIGVTFMFCIVCIRMQCLFLELMHVWVSLCQEVCLDDKRFTVNQHFLSGGDTVLLWWVLSQMWSHYWHQMASLLRSFTFNKFILTKSVKLWKHKMNFKHTIKYYCSPDNSYDAPGCCYWVWDVLY